MEALGQLVEVFTIMTSTTIATGSIPTNASYPRVHRNESGPWAPTHPPRLKNILPPVPALVVEYPQANEKNTPEAPEYNM